MNENDLYRAATLAGEESREYQRLLRESSRTRAEAVLELLTVHGKSYAEVADRLGTTRSNIQSIIRPYNTRPKRGSVSNVS